MKRKKVPVFYILFLPLVLLFDVVYYFYNRSGCLNCWNVQEFIRQSSLTVFIVSSLASQFKKSSS